MKKHKDKSNTMVLAGLGFWDGEPDGIAVCDRCGTMILYETRRCPKCHPRHATQREAIIIRNGTSYNPNIVAE